MIIRPIRILFGAVVAVALLLGLPATSAYATRPDAKCQGTVSTAGTSPGKVKATLTWDPAGVVEDYWSKWEADTILGRPIMVDVVPLGAPVSLKVPGTLASSGSMNLEIPGGLLAVSFLLYSDVGYGRTELFCTVDLQKIPDAAPGIASIIPNTAKEAGGVVATVRGAVLAGATSATIGGVPATIQSATDGEVVVVVPAGAGKIGTALDVAVVTPKGTANLPGAFTYLANPPSLSDAKPSCGLTGGETLTINGLRLGGATSVTIGGIAVPFTLTNADAGKGSISTKAPAGLSGAQSIVVSTPSGASGGALSVLYGPCSVPVPAPRIDSTRPLAAGGLVTVNWSLPSPSTDPGTNNVLGVEFAVKDGPSAPWGPWSPVGGSFSGLGGSFTIAGLTQRVVYVFLRSQSKVLGDSPSRATAAKVDFGSVPTAAPANTGNVGAVPAPVTSAGGPTTPSSAASPSATQPSSSGQAPSAAVGAAIDAPCAAPKGMLYPPVYATLGSQLTVVPNDVDGALLTKASIVAGALPPGLTLDGAFGIINGVPTRAGVYAATITGTFPGGKPRSEKVTITVQDDPQTLQYAVTNVGVVGESLDVGPSTNAPSGAAYSIVCGTVPPGIRFDQASGRFSGTPTQPYLEIAPLRIVERSGEGFAVASMILAVVPEGAATVHYPGHPHLRVKKRVAIRPSVVGATNIRYYNVVSGKLPRGLVLNHRTGVISGRAVHVSRPHFIAIAAYTNDGGMIMANTMKISIRRHRS